MKKFVVFATPILILFAALIFIFNNQPLTDRLTLLPNASPISESSEDIDLSDIPPISVVAENLSVPWAMDFLPSRLSENKNEERGIIIFAERHGEVSIINSAGKITKIADIDVYAVSESGLHGVAADPDFENNNYIYLYYTYRPQGANTLNRVSRFTLEDGTLDHETVIVDEIPGAPNHDGGRIKFGPDGYLYITTGDAQEPTLAQNKDSLAGKILRVNKNGEAAPTNPFKTKVYSYGHRNPQGITWDEKGRLWSTEHGRSGALSGLDELNLIENGKNYGWPEIQGDEEKTDMTKPVLHSSNTTWAPSGAAYRNGSIFFAGLRGQALYEYKIQQQELIPHLKEQLGRIREVIVGPDGLLYITTSNRDGRGNPTDTDDRILRINPEKLSEL